MFARLAVSFLFGCAVAVIYFLTHRRDDTYQPTFLSTLVLLTVLIAVVTLVIGNSIPKAFSLVGALSIVRFRTIVRDSRDTAFVVFAVIMGMAVGGGYIDVALAGLAVAGIAAFIVRPKPLNGAGPFLNWLLTIRIGIHQDPASLEPIFEKHVESHHAAGTATSRQGASLDLIYHARLKSSSSPAAFVSDLNRLEGVQNVELMQR
jgi:hypothetical protein